MWRGGSIEVALLVLAFFVISSTAFLPPASKCYALDRNFRLHDFTQWIGHELEHTSNDGDFIVRFCKDVQLRSGKGYVNYGRFVAPVFSSSESGDFIQNYNQGDLHGCEDNGFDLTGRNSEVTVFCGSCDQSSCTDSFGCICNVTSSSSCSSKIVAAVECGDGGPRVLRGFTVGFTPRGKEIVDGGITQWGYEKFHGDYSFSTEQRTVSLYLTAPTALSKFVQKPSFTVKPSKGLTVQLSGSAAEGESPTTESPTVLIVDWQCEKSTGGPYLVTVSVPAEGFNPIVFSLSKECEHKQRSKTSGSSAWATFGVLCLVVILMVSCCCCVGFCYNTRVEHKHGFEALPGMTTFARYFDSISGQSRRSDGYRPAEDVSTAAPPRATRTSDSKYGTV